MERIIVDFNKISNVSAADEIMIRSLADLENRIGNVSSRLALGSNTYAIKKRLDDEKLRIRNERSILKNMRTKLGNAEAYYKSTESKLAEIDKNNKDIFRDVSVAIAATVVPGVVISGYILKLLGINNPDKNHLLTDMVQSWLDGNRSPLIDMFGFEVKDKDKFGIRNVDLIKSLENEKGNMIEQKAAKLKAFNDTHKKEREIKGYWKDGTYHKVDKDDKKSKEYKEFQETQLKEAATLFSAGTSVSGALWKKEGTLEGEYGSVSGKAAIGEANAYASAHAGIYSTTADGKKIFAPGIGADIGIGISAFSASVEGKLGNEYFDVHGSASVDAAKAEAKAGINAALCDKNGNFNPKANLNASLEAVAVEGKLSGGAKIAGTDIGMTGSVKIGMGAHADIGYSDGKISLDIGASIGVGVGVKLDLDFSGTINAVSDFVSCVKWPWAK